MGSWGDTKKGRDNRIDRGHAGGKNGMGAKAGEGAERGGQQGKGRGRGGEREEGEGAHALPAPFGPSRPKHSPLSTAMVKLRTACLAGFPSCIALLRR